MDFDRIDSTAPQGPNWQENMAMNAFTPYSGSVTSGLRGDIGGENARWGINSATGKEEPLIGGRLWSDLMKQYGSFDAIQRAGQRPIDYDSMSGDFDYGETAVGRDMRLFGSRQNNDTFSGRDGARDLLTIAGMAFPVASAWAGGAAAGSMGGASAGAAGSDAAFTGGEGTFAGSSTAMPAAVFDANAVSGMSQGTGGGMMPAAVAESGATLGEFPSAAPSEFFGEFDPGGDFSLGSNIGFDGFGAPNIDSSGFGSSFDSPGMPMEATGGGFDEWWKKIKGLPWRPAGAALNFGSGLYGLHQARQMRQLAERAQDPHTGEYRDQLAALMRDPSSVKNIPGYQFGMDEGRRAIERRGAASGSGGNEAIALARYTPEYAGKFYDMEARRLANLAQGNPSAMIAGNAAASQLSSQALASLGYGAFAMGSSRFPW